MDPLSQPNEVSSVRGSSEVHDPPTISAGVAESANAPALAFPWVEHFTESGVPYYYNSSTGQSVWSMQEVRS